MVPANLTVETVDGVNATLPSVDVATRCNKTDVTAYTCSLSFDITHNPLF